MDSFFWKLGDRAHRGRTIADRRPVGWNGYGPVHLLDDAGQDIDTRSRWGGGGFYNFYGVALDPWGAVLVTGWFMNSIDLGSGRLATADGLDMDGYIARLPAGE